MCEKMTWQRVLRLMKPSPISDASILLNFDMLWGARGILSRKEIRQLSGT